MRRYIFNLKDDTRLDEGVLAIEAVAPYPSRPGVRNGCGITRSSWQGRYYYVYLTKSGTIVVFGSGTSG